jgi:transcriptional regulator with XRE-family HTH domain
VQQRSHLLNNSNPTHSFGTLLKHWRAQRGFSQLELSLASEVSQRHISFLESGRANPSLDMVLALATVLNVPLRQQNLMLTAAGFAPIYAETDLSAPEMTAMRKALDFMLRKQEPYPAIVIDRYWNLLRTNEAANRLLAAFIDLEMLQTLFCKDGKVNLMRAIFHPQGLRPFVVNWEDFAGHLLRRIHREAMSTSYGSISEAAQRVLGPADGQSEQSVALFNELMSYPGISDIWRTSNRVVQHTLLLPVHLKSHPLELQFFSTIATLGTSYDITLQELRIECFFPADEATEHNWKHL